jgi:hypothetical protein
MAGLETAIVPDGLALVYAILVRWKMKLSPKKYVEAAANGHVMVNWPDAGHRFYALLCAWLRFRHGLGRKGETVYAPGDIILPDLVGAGIRLKSGWDNWSGYYLLSDDHPGDVFLRRTFAQRA